MSISTVEQSCGMPHEFLMNVQISHPLGLDYPAVRVGSSLLLQANCFEWLARIPDCSLDGMVLDPPYGVEEYELDQLEKLRTGGAGIWRIPPTLGGYARAPLPRFTALDNKQRRTLARFFREFSETSLPKLKPGAHVLIAGNSFLSQLVFGASVEGGLEFRTEIIRLVQTLRGGDKPKNAHEEFPEVASLPRGSYEPWGLFRKPMPRGMKVSECLREFGTGGLRHRPDGNPFSDVLFSERTSKREREIAPHPSLKPQSLMRQLVRAILPLGQGVLADPFMGAGSTVAAAEAIGYSCIGIERDQEFFEMAVKAVPKLAALHVGQAVPRANEVALDF